LAKNIHLTSPSNTGRFYEDPRIKYNTIIKGRWCWRTRYQGFIKVLVCLI